MKSILTKLALIRDEFEPLKKDGRNEKQNYSFLSDKQITQKVAELFEKNKVVVTHNSDVIATTEYQTATGSKMFLKTVRIDYTFHDVDSGESLSGNVIGEGADTGDKGVYKAITGAFKYLYVKTFNIPTEDDPENERTEKYAPRPVVQKQVVNKF